MKGFVRLGTLPVELLYEIQLAALSPSLPHVSRHLCLVYKNAPASFHAQYILRRIAIESVSNVWSHTKLSKALRYPLCSKDVLDAIYRMLGCPIMSAAEPFELPRRIFRSLSPKLTKGGTNGVAWTERHHPLPFLNYLCQSDHFPPPDVNAHEGYALTKAVHAGFLPLIQFLLRHGASPKFKDGLSVVLAIRRKDLALVRLLVEREGSASDHRGKRGRLEDRVQVNSHMLNAAVQCDARDIVEYLTKEKGFVPDITTLHMVMRTRA